MSEHKLLSVSGEGNLSEYLREINSIPMLEPEQEYTLSKKWINESDVTAAQNLVASHLRLVAKIAMGYKNYGIPIFDLIGEGILGLMHAVKKFNPDLGARLATYASWWIKASIQDYILKYLRVGTSAQQKSLFFNLRKIKSESLALYGHSNDESIDDVAESLNVSREDVISMGERIRSDVSLNELSYEDGETELIDNLEDPNANYAECYIEDSDLRYKKILLQEAIATTLNERERVILNDRAEGIVLEDLSKKYGLSRERVRQIYHRAIDKVSEYVLKRYNSSN